LWHAEAERTQSRLDDLNQGSSERAKEQAWYDYCFHKHEQVAWELDNIQNPPKHSEPEIVNLDDLDRHED
jgi:hypothetical protein